MGLDSYLTRQLIAECEKQPVEVLRHRLGQFLTMIHELEERAEIVRRKIREREEEAAMPESSPAPAAGTIHWTSGVNREGKPFVMLEWGAETAQVSPDDARAIGGVAFAVAEAAEMDATVWDWLASSFPELPVEHRMHLLMTFREHRDAARAKGEAA